MSPIWNGASNQRVSIAALSARFPSGFWVTGLRTQQHGGRSPGRHYRRVEPRLDASGPPGQSQHRHSLCMAASPPGGALPVLDRDDGQACSFTGPAGAADFRPPSRAFWISSSSLAYTSAGISQENARSSRRAFWALARHSGVRAEIGTPAGLLPGGVQGDLRRQGGAGSVLLRGCAPPGSVPASASAPAAAHTGARDLLGCICIPPFPAFSGCEEIILRHRNRSQGGYRSSSR